MKSSLESNIAKYCLFRIFTKRTFLPLIAIYLIDYGGVTLEEIAVIWSITALVSLLLEIPAGYIADWIGHRKALILGTAIAAISVLPYIFMPNFYGAMVASILFFGGYAFLSGTIQAFIHETLLALKREHEYSRIMGMAQSYGLLGNVVLIILVPMTYVIDPVLPFILGFLCLAANCGVAWSFVSPPERLVVAQQKDVRHLLEKLKALKSGSNLVLLVVIFALFGVASSSYQNAILYREVIFRDVGIPVAYFGIILAAGSLLAAIVGLYIHLLEKLKPGVFYMLDSFYLCAAYYLVGITDNPVVIIFAFLLFIAYERTRNIIFEAHIFREFPYTHYKSTIMSMLNFSTLVNALWGPLLLSALVHKTTLSTGYMLYGGMMALILGLLLVIYLVLNCKHLFLKHGGNL